MSKLKNNNKCILTGSRCPNSKLVKWHGDHVLMHPAHSAFCLLIFYNSKPFKFKIKTGGMANFYN